MLAKVFGRSSKPIQRFLMPCKIYLQTFGCQMNVYDSERLMGLLVSEGHTLTKDPKEADVIVLNTCSVRDTAESRALGRLTEFQKYKRQNPEVKLVVAGCMAQRMGTHILNRVPLVDLILGPDQILSLADYLRDHQQHSRIDVSASRDDFDSEGIWEPEILPRRKTPYTSFVAISRGCDNFCSYCVVPFVRGPERNRPAEQIIREVQRTAESGRKEATLIGQNVNSYRHQGGDFADLLQMVNDRTKIEWIHFMTSHPKDSSDKLIDKIARLPKVCEHVHLPLQSGSDRILKMMNRGYTSMDYLKLAKKIKESISDVSLTTDLIVGFPSETGDDFQRTLDMVQEIEFDSAFMFRYSVREGTKAATWPDDVPEEDKLNRLHALIKLQKEISKKRNQGLLGKVLQVLIDGISRRDQSKWKGKTRANQTVIVEGDDNLLGQIVPVMMDQADSFTLFGHLAGARHQPNPSRSENHKKKKVI
jgi:tRNA-2-methylthio-N6-dimethylallyladenosine synthase